MGSLAASSVTLLVAVLVLGTTSVKADFLDKNFLDNLFSFSGSQSPDYPSYDDVQQYPQYDGTDKQEDADAEEVKKPVKDVGGGRHVKAASCQHTATHPIPVPRATPQRTAALRWRSLRTGRSSAGNIRLHKTACATQSTCFLVQMSTPLTQCTKISRTQVSLDSMP